MPYYVFSSSVFWHVQDFAYNLRFKLSFIVAFFRVVHKKNFSEGPPLSIGPFQKVQRETIYFPYVVRKNEKGAIKCPKIVAHTVKIAKYLVWRISEHP